MTFYLWIIWNESLYIMINLKYLNDMTFDLWIIWNESLYIMINIVFKWHDIWSMNNMELIIVHYDNYVYMHNWEWVPQPQGLVPIQWTILYYSSHTIIFSLLSQSLGLWCIELRNGKKLLNVSYQQQTREQNTCEARDEQTNISIIYQGKF